MIWRQQYYICDFDCRVQSCMDLCSPVVCRGICSGRWLSSMCQHHKTCTLNFNNPNKRIVGIQIRILLFNMVKLTGCTRWLPTLPFARGSWFLNRPLGVGVAPSLKRIPLRILFALACGSLKFTTLSRNFIWVNVWTFCKLSFYLE